MSWRDKDKLINPIKYYDKILGKDASDRWETLMNKLIIDSIMQEKEVNKQMDTEKEIYGDLGFQPDANGGGFTGVDLADAFDDGDEIKLVLTASADSLFSVEKRDYFKKPNWLKRMCPVARINFVRGVFV